MSALSEPVPWFRWLHPKARTDRLRFYDELLPSIFQRTFSEVGDISAFEGILRYEQKLRWDEKKAMDKLRGRYDLCEKYEHYVSSHFV
jgi:hypothetical protein